MSAAFHELRVSVVIRETADCSSFELEVPAALKKAFRYRAGQHLTVEIPWASSKLTRCYSLSSSPDLDEKLKIGVKRVAGGRISNWLNDNLKPGHAIMASVPEGRFVLEPQTRSGAPLFLFAAGSGITPIIALLKSALATSKRSITLLYANQNEASVIYGPEVSQLAAEHPGRVAVHLHFDSTNGYLESRDVRKLLHHSDVAEYYICGPEPFMELVEHTLEEAGVHDELVYIERFVSPADPERIGARRVDEASLQSPRSFSLWLDGRSRTVPYMKGRTLLECARDAGFQPAHSCESGYCGSCMAHVNTGKVYMRTHEALSERDIGRGVALLCQSLPASTEPLELDSDSTSFRAASAVKSSYGKRASRLAALGVFAFMLAGTLILRLVD